MGATHFDLSMANQRSLRGLVPDEEACHGRVNIAGLIATTLDRSNPSYNSRWADSARSRFRKLCMARSSDGSDAEPCMHALAAAATCGPYVDCTSARFFMADLIGADEPIVWGRPSNGPAGTDGSLPTLELLSQGSGHSLVLPSGAVREEPQALKAPPRARGMPPEEEEVRRSVAAAAAAVAAAEESMADLGTRGLEASSPSSSTSSSPSSSLSSSPSPSGAVASAGLNAAPSAEASATASKGALSDMPPGTGRGLQAIETGTAVSEPVVSEPPPSEPASPREPPDSNRLDSELSHSEPSTRPAATSATTPAIAPAATSAASPAACSSAVEAAVYSSTMTMEDFILKQKRSSPTAGKSLRALYDALKTCMGFPPRDLFHAEPGAAAPPERAVLAKAW